MKARTVMTREVVWVEPEAKLATVEALMKHLGIRHLPVLEGGLLEGILSDRDVLLRSALTRGGEVRLADVTAAEAMTRKPITCSPEATVGTVATLMLENRIDCIPVVSLGKVLVGIVTSTDLLELLRDPEHNAERLPFHFTLRHSPMAYGATVA